MNDPQSQPQLQDKRTCDIVMKGGITSGVVYPKAIAKLSTRFTFKNVGGTSAGAIAAAAAAAAEYRRVRTGSDEGFTMLAGLGDQLASKPEGSKHTMLFSLFAPNATTKRIFNVVTSLIGNKSMWKKSDDVMSSGIGNYWIAAIIGVIPGLALLLISCWLSGSVVLTAIWGTIGILLAVVGSVLAIIASLAVDLIRNVPRNNFGLCNGMPDSKCSSEQPLTVWLTQYLNRVAGITDEKPLTFGDLWNPSGKPRDDDTRDVNLEMMTTNLTHGRPYRLPFRYDADLKENDRFYFRRDEFRSLFPRAVVKWMVDNPRPLRGQSPKEIATRKADREKRLAAGFYPMPGPEDLPVIVATRMSLSFPVLLSMVPLYGIERTSDNPDALPEKCWFTDGGACSNFPLHFFDAPIPRRPTFSLDLIPRPDDASPDDLLPEMDENNIPSHVDRWNRFDWIVSKDRSSWRKKGNLGQLTGFAGSLISTMQNWNDATQGRLPGYRDRIARIPLTSKHGGLNLDMPPGVVTFLSGQGEKCADKFLDRFDVEPKHDRMNWENHRWIRLRSMMAAFERMVGETLDAAGKPEGGDESYEIWLARLDAGQDEEYKKLSYPITKKQIRTALRSLEKMKELKSIWDEGDTGSKDAPKPRPVLRHRPQI